MSALKVEPLSTGSVPVRFVGVASAPVAVSVQSVLTAVPPLSLTTTLRRCRAGGLSLLVIVQVTCSAFARVILFGLTNAPPPEQDQTVPAV